MASIEPSDTVQVQQQKHIGDISIASSLTTRIHSQNYDTPAADVAYSLTLPFNPLGISNCAKFEKDNILERERY
jgi:hypothetical protein